MFGYRLRLTRALAGGALAAALTFTFGMPAALAAPGPLPAGATSSADVLNPLAADARRADNPDKTPIALRLPGPAKRIVGARVSTTPPVADLGAAKGHDYFVDCAAAAAGADGTQQHPFNTLAEVNQHAPFVAGDRILFKRGTTCTGLLTPAGSGAAGKPIVIDAYGDRSAHMPVLNGAGMTESPSSPRLPDLLKQDRQKAKGYESAVVRFYNQQHWAVRNLEITNHSDDAGDYHKRRRGVVVAAQDFGQVSDFEISDLYIHDVLGAPDKDLGGSGAIQFEAYAGPAKRPTSFTGLKVHHNRIRHVSRSGINEGSNFRSRGEVGGYIRDNAFAVWAPMDVHDNIVSDVAGDGIVIQFASNTQVYNNTVWDTANFHGGKARAGSNAAVWAWDADHVHFYNNHVFDTVRPGGNNDGTAFDSDYGTTGNTFEYNVSHDNQGGFMLFCGCGGLSTQTVMRYNLSLNDGRGGENDAKGARVFFVAGQTDGEVYNNTFLLYPGVTIDKGSSPRSAVYYGSNVFLAQGAVSTTWTPALAATSPFRDNVYAGGSGSWPSPATNNVKPALTAMGKTGLERLKVNMDQVGTKGRPVAKGDVTDILGALVPAHMSPDPGAFQTSPVTAAQAKYHSSVVSNGGFESADAPHTQGWQLSGAKAVADQHRGGKYSLQLSGASSMASQDIPVGVNRTYRLLASVAPDSAGHVPTVSVVNPGGHAAVAKTMDGKSVAGWQNVSALMRTAWDASKLTVKVSGSGAVDDIALVPEDDFMVDGSFQSLGNSPWGGKRATDAVSGGLAMSLGKYGGQSMGRGQENWYVTVPEVGKDYQVTAWAKVTTPGAQMQIGAKRLGEGAQEKYVRGGSSEYMQYSVPVKPQGSPFTVYCWLPKGGTGGLCDDVMLTRAWDGKVPQIPAADGAQTNPVTKPAEPTGPQHPLLLPMPNSVEYPDQPGYELTDQTCVATQGEHLDYATQLLSQSLGRSYGVKLPTGKAGQKCGVSFVLDPKLAKAGDEQSSEAYKLMVNKDGITVRAASPRAAIWAAQTLLQLVGPWAYAPTQVGYGVLVPAVNIADQPRYAWRGIMLDPARSFIPVDEVKRAIDEMSRIKMNVLHMHVTDDQGWRVEIQNPTTPDPDGIDYSLLTKRSGATALQAGGSKFNPAPGRSGYYTKAQFIDLVKYAAEHGVTVVPEIDGPGHTNAMLHALPQLNTQYSSPRPAPGDDTVPAFQEKFWSRTSVDSESPVTYRVMKYAREVLMDYVREGTQAAGMPQLAPQYFHVGGDEATVTHDYRGYMQKIMDSFQGDKYKPIVWNDTLGTASQTLPNGTLVQYWTHTDMLPRIAKWVKSHDGQIIMSPATNAYYPQRPAKDVAGPAWACGAAGYCGLNDYYNWDPSSMAGVSDAYVKGVEGPMWSEHLRTEHDMEFQMYPRTYALAEVGWTDQNKRDFTDFKKRLSPRGVQRVILGETFQLDADAAPWHGSSHGVVVPKPQPGKRVLVGYIAQPGLTSLSGLPRTGMLRDAASRTLREATHGVAVPLSYAMDRSFHYTDPNRTSGRWMNSLVRVYTTLPTGVTNGPAVLDLGTYPASDRVAALPIRMTVQLGTPQKPSPSPSASGSASPSPSASGSASPSPSASGSASLSPSASGSASPSPAASGSASPSSSGSASPSSSGSASPSSSGSAGSSSQPKADDNGKSKAKSGMDAGLPKMQPRNPQMPSGSASPSGSGSPAAAESRLATTGADAVAPLLVLVGLLTLGGVAGLASRRMNR